MFLNYFFLFLLSFYALLIFFMHLYIRIMDDVRIVDTLIELKIK